MKFLSRFIPLVIRTGIFIFLSTEVMVKKIDLPIHIKILALIAYLVIIFDAFMMLLKTQKDYGEAKRKDWED